MTIFGRGAVGKPVVHPEDLSPDLALIGIRTCGLDHAGEFVPENRAGSSSPLPGMRGRIPLQLRWSHSRRVDANKDFLTTGLGHRSRARDQGGRIQRNR